jgi:hypothetical protein
MLPRALPRTLTSHRPRSNHVIVASAHYRHNLPSPSLLPHTHHLTCTSRACPSTDAHTNVPLLQRSSPQAFGTAGCAYVLVRGVSATGKARCGSALEGIGAREAWHASPTRCGVEASPTSVARAVCACKRELLRMRSCRPQLSARQPRSSQPGVSGPPRRCAQRTCQTARAGVVGSAGVDSRERRVG